MGKYGNLTVEEARKQAKSLLGSVARGDDPIAEKKTKKVHAMTLQQVLNDYLKARKDLKPRTLNDYQCVLHEVVPDWLDKPLVCIQVFSYSLPLKNQALTAQHHELNALRWGRRARCDPRRRSQS